MCSAVLHRPPPQALRRRWRRNDFRRFQRLDDDFENPIVERLAGRTLLRNEAFPQSLAGEGPRAKVAHRIVADTSQNRVSAEAASAQTGGGERTGTAEAPKIIHCARAIESDD